MPRLLIINPNTTASMTAKIAEAAQAVAAPGTEISTRNPASGPVSIEGYSDEAYSVLGLLALIREGEAAGVDGFVIACADDPGLGAARELATGPVVGIGEAAMHTAALLGTRFSIITTLARTLPVFQDNVTRYGLERRCASVRAAELPVLDLETDPKAREAVRAECLRAIQDDGAECLVLGCAGMADLVAWLQDTTGVPVVDGVTAGVKLIEGLIAQGLKTSKVGAYAYPRAKPYSGDLAYWSPGGGH